VLSDDTGSRPRDALGEDSSARWTITRTFTSDVTQFFVLNPSLNLDPMTRIVTRENNGDEGANANEPGAAATAARINTNNKETPLHIVQIQYPDALTGTNRDQSRPPTLVR